MGAAEETAGGGALAAAISEWVSIVGREHALGPDSPEARAASQATFSTEESRALAVVRPANVDELRACLRVANKHRVPVYPVSRGKNYGYGSRVPPRQAAVLELRRMDRILEYDEEMGYVTVEPGVTFRQLAEFLESQGSTLRFNLTEGPQDGSLVGNTLDRGQSAGQDVSSARAVGDFEVVLADGTLFRTGSGHFPHSRLGQLEPFPLGPDTRGLFIESNLGVVSRMTIHLQRAMDDVRLVTLSLPERDDLRVVLPVLRDLTLEGLLPPGAVNFHNDYNQAMWSYDYRYPWDDLPSGRPPLPRPLLRQRELKAWYGIMPIFSANEAIGRRRVALIEQRLEGTPAKVSRLDGWVYRALLAARRPAGWLAGMFESAAGLRKSTDFLAHLQGEPRPPEALRGPYWRKRQAAPGDPDPDRDRCGWLSYSITTPASSAEVLEATEMIEEIVLRHELEPVIHLRIWEPRSVLFHCHLVYDRDEPGDDERARTCYLELLQELGARGYLPYRLPVFAMEQLPAFDDGYGTLMRRLKEALDPHDILSPGRYDFRNNWPQEGE